MSLIMGFGMTAAVQRSLGFNDPPAREGAPVYVFHSLTLSSPEELSIECTLTARNIIHI